MFAKWTDCRMYPARVTRVNHNGSYEVLFYDGFRKTVQDMNSRAMPPDIQQEVGVDSANVGRIYWKMCIALTLVMALHGLCLWPPAQRSGLLGVGNSVLFMTHVAITVGAC